MDTVTVHWSKHLINDQIDSFHLVGVSVNDSHACSLLMKHKLTIKIRVEVFVYMCVWMRETGIWLEVLSEQEHPRCLLSSLSRLWSASSIVSERSLHLFSSEVSRPPCHAFTRIYKVCNLPCVGFLIFWIAKIKHMLLLKNILFDSHALFCFW